MNMKNALFVVEIEQGIQTKVKWDKTIRKSWGLGPKVLFHVKKY